MNLQRDPDIAFFPIGDHIAQQVADISPGDLSSEPLIIVCAAGTRETVLGDIIKDTAIFKAHKAVPIIIADEGENRFAPYAADVFHVPAVSEHLAPVVNTLVGHIWGYYAALAINEGSRFLYDFRQDVQKSIDDAAAKAQQASVATRNARIKAKGAVKL